MTYLILTTDCTIVTEWQQRYSNGAHRWPWHRRKGGQCPVKGALGHLPHRARWVWCGAMLRKWITLQEKMQHTICRKYLQTIIIIQTWSYKHSRSSKQLQHHIYHRKYAIKKAITQSQLSGGSTVEARHIHTSTLDSWNKSDWPTSYLGVESVYSNVNVWDLSTSVRGNRPAHCSAALGMRLSFIFFKRLNEPCKRLRNVETNIAACVPIPWPSRSKCISTQ